MLSLQYPLLKSTGINLPLLDKADSIPLLHQEWARSPTICHQRVAEHLDLLTSPVTVQIVHYIDDIMIQGETEQEARKDLDLLIPLIMELKYGCKDITTLQSQLKSLLLGKNTVLVIKSGQEKWEYDPAHKCYIQE